MLKGETHFEGWLLKQGDCGYFPESVPYGPQEQHGGDGLVLTLQLPGPSEQYYPLPNEVNFASAALRERDPLFGRGGRARNIRGEEVDSFEAIWESVKGERICYAEPSCSDIVIMPRSAAHLIAVTRPFSILQRGRFEPHDLEILTIQASGASELGFDPASRGELWFLNRGDIRMGAESYGAFSAFQLLPGARPIPIHASMDTEFFVIRLPFRSGIPKDAEVLPSPVGEVPVNSGTHASVLRY